MGLAARVVARRRWWGNGLASLALWRTTAPIRLASNMFDGLGGGGQHLVVPGVPVGVDENFGGAENLAGRPVFGGGDGGDPATFAPAVRRRDQHAGGEGKLAGERGEAKQRAAGGKG